MQQFNITNLNYGQNIKSEETEKCVNPVRFAGAVAKIRRRSLISGLL